MHHRTVWSNNRNRRRIPFRREQRSRQEKQDGENNKRLSRGCSHRWSTMRITGAGQRCTNETWAQCRVQCICDVRPLRMRASSIPHRSRPTKRDQPRVSAPNNTDKNRMKPSLRTADPPQCDRPNESRPLRASRGGGSEDSGDDKRRRKSKRTRK